MIRKYVFIFFVLVITFCSTVKSQDFKISKINHNYTQETNTLVYALPRTYISVVIEITKRTTIKGPYAGYAEKYLGLSNVPLENSEHYEITSLSINPINEPDPEFYFALTYKNLPVNVHSILSKENYGVMLNLDVKRNQKIFFHPENEAGKVVFDPHLIDETVKQHIDTLYKTILNDTAFIRVPIFKKQIQAKTNEDLIKETAHELIKTRKRKIKLARGEFEFHPDGETLKVMFDELQKQENDYLALFQGKILESKQTFSYTIFPNKELSPLDLCYFSPIYGLLSTKIEECKPIKVQFVREETNQQIKVNQEKLTDQNVLYYRVPLMTNVLLQVDSIEKAKCRIPLYQFGNIQSMLLNTK